MKKIMMMAVAALVTGLASAANVNWSVAGKTFAPSADDSVSTNGRAKNYLVYAFAATDLDAVTAALAAGDAASAIAMAKSDGRTTATGASSGVISGVTGSTYDIFLVAFDTTTADGTVNDAKNYLVSSIQSGATYEPPATATTIAYTASNFGGGSWTPMSVPEPTSGLLLLLGMAGLALKRKQA